MFKEEDKQYLREIRKIEVRKNIKLPHLKSYTRKEIRENRFINKVHWNRLEIRLEPIYKEAKEKLEKIKELL